MCETQRRHSVSHSVVSPQLLLEAWQQQSVSPFSIHSSENILSKWLIIFQFFSRLPKLQTNTFRMSVPETSFFSFFLSFCPCHACVHAMCLEIKQAAFKILHFIQVHLLGTSVWKDFRRLKCTVEYRHCFTSGI